MMYNYRKTQYFVGVTLTGIFCAGLFLFSIYKICQGFLVPLMVLIALLSLYTVWNTFIARTNPNEVEITDEFISFSSYNQKSIYML